MRATRLTSVLFALVCLAASALAAPVSGTITNATTGKPASGATVTILDPMAGMLEVGSGKADVQGRYSIEVPPAKGPRLVRAERSGVHYFKMIPPGTENADLEVYDAASSVNGIKGTADVLRMQTQEDALQVSEMFVVSNESKPPKALAAPATFEFVLPDGAQIDAAHARAPNGQPISVETKPVGGKNRYAFSFALKPGDTRLEVTYHLPYSGEKMFSPQLLRGFDHFVVILPSTMQFIAHDPKQFQSMDANQPGTTVEVSMHAKDGEKLGFSVSGTGTYPDESASGTPGGTAGGGPGGGLGRPIDAPDSLAQYRYYILAALVIILIGGGIWIHERTSKEAVAAAMAPGAEEAAPSAAGAQAPASPAAPAAKAASPLLAALKEEIFALEVEFKEGKISQEEYNKARAALDQTLQRAVSRKES
jgi:hypothetical protein